MHFRGLGEGCPFSTERENKVGHSEASKRPRFPGCPLRGFQPSGSYPQATDNKTSCDVVKGIVLPKNIASCDGWPNEPAMWSQGKARVAIQGVNEERSKYPGPENY